MPPPPDDNPSSPVAAPPAGGGAQGKFFFTASAGGPEVRSGTLGFTDFVEFTLDDKEGKPAPGKLFTLTTPAGVKLTGRTDAQGHARIDGVPTGECDVEVLGDTPAPPADQPGALPLPPDTGPKPADPQPPSLLKVVNLLPIPQHGVSGPQDVAGIAAHIAKRAREGIADMLSHPEYNQMAMTPQEQYARAVAEHQTCAPYTWHCYFYPEGLKAPKRFHEEGLYPLMGQCQQSTTHAMMIGGFDASQITIGKDQLWDLGSGTGTPGLFKQLGKWWQPSTGLVQWSDAEWQALPVGACIVGASTGGIGHIFSVLRKHPSKKLVQLWDTCTAGHLSMNKQSPPAGCRSILSEGLWKNSIAPPNNYLGMGVLKTFGTVKQGLKPRGHCRLLIRQRASNQLVYRSSWIFMAEKGLPMTWLLRSLRGVPFCDQVEAMWCINTEKKPGKDPNIPLLDLFCDAQGNARVLWNDQSRQHGRKNAADAVAAAPIGSPNPLM